ncbi:MAG: RNA polymerase subunit sigma-24 [Cereibacter sphaeroides]|uniref:RNA polymerase subunit sigma-24 n=1 Tax=Cereibacter sphaeroides TaxID=1063 RepID=A0A2W5S4D7_CERSP|nr:MAG: RNA polymerase subunit sigma-24 [Cereibacter sphaeroides]
MADTSYERAFWLSRHILPHEGALRAWLGRRIHTGIDIDDIVQEAYAKLAMLDSVAHITNPRAYFFQCAHSIVLQDIRRSRIVPIDSIHDMGALEIEAGQPMPDREAADRQELRIVMAAIEALPRRCRDVFLLRKVQGLSQREVAGQLGLSESTVEKHVAKGIGKLLDFFSDSGNGARRASIVENIGDQVHGKRK